MSFDERDFIPISALQHYLYCPRQCALIHIEQVWADSVDTSLGNILHERVHEISTESRKNAVEHQHVGPALDGCMKFPLKVGRTSRWRPRFLSVRENMA